MNLIIIHFFPASYSMLPLRPKYLPWHAVFKY
jgi:hypothetical protein